ncbi:MAG: hypothetical protein ABSG13_12375 [Bryobacteraceae bacterium]
MNGPFQLLLKLFRNRFLENDTVSPGGGFQTNIYQVLGVLATVGMFVGYYVMPEFMIRSLRPAPARTDWNLQTLRMFFPAYSFGVAGLAAVFHWDMLFPDRRDFLILTPFPIRLRELIAAKFLAFVFFLLLIAAAVNVSPDSMVVLVGLFAPNHRGVGLRLAAAQIAATGGASAFAFLAVAAGQGILINLTSPKIFRRVSPWIQMLGMCAMLLTVLGFPVYSAFLRPAIEQRQLWLYLFPPAWFSGLYEVFLGGPNPFLASFGMLAIQMTALALLVIFVTWGLGFRRHFRRTLEAEDGAHPPRPWSVPDWLVRSPRERALFGFTAKTLARSQKHQFFLATYLSIGLSIAMFFGVAIRDGKIALSADGARSMAFVLGFFVISGFRAVFQFPAELNANWLFRLTEARWTEVSRNATRKLVLALGLVPLLLVSLPLEIATWDWPTVLEHSAVQLLAAAVLVELLFWNFDKVPFTCSYFPGTTSLAVLGVLYIYGITGYSFHMADLESAMERYWMVAVLFFAASALALTLAWRRHPAEEGVRFDGSEPVIQSLELN